MSIAEAVRLAECEKKIAELLRRVAELEAMTQAESDRSEIAEDWLRDVLSAGQVEAANIRRQAVAQGFNWRTVQRARERIGATSTREGFGRGSRVLWTLP